MPRFWTCYWQFKNWTANAQYAEVWRSGNNSFQQRGVKQGDWLYIVSRGADGQLLLGGKMQVAEIAAREDVIKDPRAGDRKHADRNLYPCELWARGIPGTGTPFHWKRTVANELSREIRFISKVRPGLRFKQGKLDEQTLRNIRELTSESAAFLDTIISITDALPRNENGIVVTRRFLAETDLYGSAKGEAASRAKPRAPARTEPRQFLSCFISYSHADRIFAIRLHDALEAHGVRCWLDENDMLPGDDIYNRIDQGIRQHDKILICCSKVSLRDSWWVDNELEAAFAKERELQREHGRKAFSIIPLAVDDSLQHGKVDNGKLHQLRSRVAANFQGWETDPAIFEQQTERLVRALRIDAGVRTAHS